MASSGDRFTIEPNRWYAWQMFPGYVDEAQFCPYLSPVYIERIRPKSTAGGLFEVALINAAYTEGIQRYEGTLKILKRASTYAVAEIGGEPDRAAVIGEISFEWLGKHYPDWFATVPADSTDVQAYLERRLGLLHS